MVDTLLMRKVLGGHQQGLLQSLSIYVHGRLFRQRHPQLPTQTQTGTYIKYNTVSK